MEAVAERIADEAFDQLCERAGVRLKMEAKFARSMQTQRSFVGKARAVWACAVSADRKAIIGILRRGSRRRRIGTAPQVAGGFVMRAAGARVAAVRLSSRPESGDRSPMAGKLFQCR